jgi:hypothetical protein
MGYEDKAWRHSGRDSGEEGVRRFQNLSVVGTNHELLLSMLWKLLVAARGGVRTCETVLVKCA